MNSYPKWWDDTITLYNKYEDPVTNLVSWTRHTIENCFVKRASNKAVIGQMVLESNVVIIRIRESDTYKTYAEWVQLPNDSKSQYFTVHSGDIVVFGAVDDDINEYTTGHRSTDILSKYRGLDICCVVTANSENVGNRTRPHYYVQGE